MSTALQIGLVRFDPLKRGYLSTEPGFCPWLAAGLGFEPPKVGHFAATLGGHGKQQRAAARRGEPRCGCVCQCNMSRWLEL